MSRRRTAAAALLTAFLTGCSAAAPPSGAPDEVQNQLSAQQQALEAAALRGLDGRTCAALPAPVRLAGLPSTELPCLGTGPARDVAAGDGRPTVVNLWASWCAPCVREMPLLQATAGRVGDAVRFVGIDTQDEPASAAGLLAQTGVRYDQYDDPDGKVRSAVRAVGLPVTLIYDGQGREVARRFGEIRGSALDDALRRAGVPVPAAGS